MRKIIIIVGGLILVGIFIFVQFFAKFTPKVVSIQPVNGAKDVNVKSVIEIKFEKAVPQTEHGNFNIQLIPGVQTENVWVSSTVSRVTPQADLVPTTNYTITVSFEDEEMFRSSFETQFIKQYTEEEVQELTNMAQEVSAGFYEVTEKYPFLEDLPILRDNYTVVFDFDLQQFRIRLKMPATVPEETKQEAINSALSEMATLQINVEQYGYYVLYSE